LNKSQLFAAALCAAILAPAAPASAKAKPKPLYTIQYSETYKSKTVSRCPIPTGGFTTDTATYTEDYSQSGRLGGDLTTVDTRQTGTKQEVEDSTFVQPSDNPGQPETKRSKVPSKDVVEIRKGKLIFTRPGYSADPAKLTVKLPAKKGGSARAPVSKKTSSGPTQSDNGCTDSDESQLTGALVVTRRR
jgi:hypothetical protein